MEVLYEDDVLIAVAKPSGTLVHRGWGDDGPVLVDEVHARFGGGVHPVHRLDRGTSGVVVFARRPEITALLQKSFEDGGAEKRYLAFVRGVPPPLLTVDHPIPRREDGPRVPALTEIALLASIEEAELGRRFSWVEARPRSGRLHQVRRHLKHAGHPVIGDANYGKGDLNRWFRDRRGLARLALHAVELALPHPIRGERLVLRAPVPDDLRVPLSALGLIEERLFG